MIEHYFDNPLDFFEDILQVVLTEQQIDLLKKVPKAINNKKNISVKAGHLWCRQNVYRSRLNNLVSSN